MSRPSVHRSEFDREKDVALMWLSEWLKDVSASLQVIHNVVAAAGSGLSHFAAQVESIKTDVDEMVSKMEDE